jgi:hypothetical protein
MFSVLSAFEESSAACISDMLRAVSSGQYLEAIRMAEKFILHVEILFAVIDDLEGQFAVRSAKGIPSSDAFFWFTDAKLIKVSLMYGRPECYVERLWISSLSCREPTKNQNSGGLG